MFIISFETLKCKTIQKTVHGMTLGDYIDEKFRDPVFYFLSTLIPGVMIKNKN